MEAIGAITDPEDWGPLSPARKLDASLRCAVCGELFSAPVTLGCGHACEFQKLSEGQACFVSRGDDDALRGDGGSNDAFARSHALKLNPHKQTTNQPNQPNSLLPVRPPQL